MPSSNYGEDDYVAALSYAGPPPLWDKSKSGRGVTTGTQEWSNAMERRRAWYMLIETFCTHWFEGKPIDGQWANFSTNFEQWYEGERNVQQTERDDIRQPKEARGSAEA